MSFASFVAKRYLFSRRKQAFIYVISLMSILGVALGVAALVVVLGVYNGLTTDMRDKILGANAHGVVLGSLPDSFALEPDITDVIMATPGVTGATPFIYSEVMLSAGTGVKGLILRGIDPVGAPDVVTMLGAMHSGGLDGLKEGTPPGIILGYELARRLSLQTGSRINLLSPSGERTAAGFQPRIRPFKISGIFKTGMYEYDSSLAFVSLDACRDLLGTDSSYLTGIEITVRNLFDADKVTTALNERLGYRFHARSWMDMNANLFAALKLEKIGMFILLAMVVLIGSFSIVATLVMLVMEKTRDIAVMMSMGATRSMVRRIFMIQGLLIGIVGTAFGNMLGLTVGYLLKKYQFIKLPENVYSLDHLPIIITGTDVAIISASALLLCFFATIYPARQASRLKPAEALRYE